MDDPILDFIGAKGDGGGGNDWSYKMSKAPVNKPTPNFFTGQMPFLSPNQQCQSAKGKRKIIDYWRDYKRYHITPITKTEANLLH